MKKSLKSLGISFAATGFLLFSSPVLASSHEYDGEHCDAQFNNIYRIKKGKTITTYSLDSNNKNKIKDDGTVKPAGHHSHSQYITVLKSKNSLGRIIINGKTYRGIVDSKGVGHYIQQSDLSKLSKLKFHDEEF